MPNTLCILLKAVNFSLPKGEKSQQNLQFG